MSTPAADEPGTLHLARLTGLLRSTFSVEIADTEIESLPFGITARRADHGWCLARTEELSVLGGVCLWRDRRDLLGIDLLVDHNAGVHARRAGLIAPTVRVWSVAGAAAAAAIAEPLPPADEVAPEAAAVADVITGAGADVVIEAGIVRAEVLGLEIGRVAGDPPELQVGVGAYDREAGAVLHPDRPAGDHLGDLVAMVRRHRRAGVALHPMNRLARARWLRAVLVADPDRIGSGALDPVEPIPLRVGLLEDVPAAAVDAGSDALVVCSVGVDIGLVPTVADLVLRHDPRSVILVMPRRDHFEPVERLANAMPVPTTVVGVDPPWSAVV